MPGSTPGIIPRLLSALAGRSALFMLSAGLLSILLVGCAARTAVLSSSVTEEVPVTTSNTPAPTETQPFTATPRGTATTQALLTPTQPAPRPTQPAPTKQPRPESGWTVYSNPNFIRAITVHERQLWAATLGGVAVWDLDSEKQTLYTTRSGLADIQANDIVYCPVPEERLIVAHASGVLSEYNLALKKWSRVPVTMPDGSTFTQVQALLCDAENRRLLIGSPDGLGILDFKTGRWKRLGPAEGLNLVSVQSIHVVGQVIWIAAGEQGAFMIQGSTIFPFNGESGFPSGPVNDLAIAVDQSLWLGYPTGLVHYYDRKWNSYGAQMPTGIPFYSVDLVEVGPDKRIWIASMDGGICPFEPFMLMCSTIYPGIRGVAITDLIVDSDGTAYAGTDGSGVLVLGKEDVRTLVFENQQIISNDIYDLAESPDGKLWVSTDRGVNILDPLRPSEPWQSLEPARGQMAFPRVSGLQPAHGGMWFFYEDQPQASFFDGKDWLQIDALRGIAGPVLASAVDQNGYTWMATTHAINIWDNAVIRSYGPENGLPGNVYQSLLTGTDGMWVGTDRGLLHYERYQWKLVLPDISVRAMVQGQGSDLLLGTDQGLIRFDGSQSFLWIINLGETVVTNPVVNSITYDHNGNLWVGTQGDGLFVYDGSRWERYDTTLGLPTNIIRKVFTDHLGAVWIAAATGKRGGALVRFMP